MTEHGGPLARALGTALRIVEERADLLERMALDARATGRTLTAASFAQKASELRDQAEILRSAARAVRRG